MDTIPGRAAPSVHDWVTLLVALGFVLVASVFIVRQSVPLEAPTGEPSAFVVPVMAASPSVTHTAGP